VTVQIKRQKQDRQAQSSSNIIHVGLQLDLTIPCPKSRDQASSIPQVDPAESTDQNALQVIQAIPQDLEKDPKSSSNTNTNTKEKEEEKENK
jgi:hypothetical protein